jgi:hypothetical protein
VNQRANINKDLSIDVPIHLLYFLHAAPRTKHKGLLIDVSYHLLYFLHVQRHVQKARGSRLTSQSSLILFTRVAPRTKSKRLSIDVPIYLILFTRAMTYHHTFHTQQSSVSKKQGASIYLYLSRYAAESVHIILYVNISLLQPAEKILQGSSTRTSIIIRLIEYREIILGRKILSGIIYIIN